MPRESRSRPDPAEARCTRELHEALKLDPVAFRKATHLVGMQEDGFREPVELRNCTRCGSTLVAPRAKAPQEARGDAEDAKPPARAARPGAVGPARPAGAR